MPNYEGMQLISYGSVTSNTTQVLPNGSVNKYQEDLDARAETLCGVAEWVTTAFQPELASEQVLKIFVAPEFYFRYGGPSDPATALLESYPDAELKIPNMAETVLKKRFAQPVFKDWLIVAGTVFWHKPPEQTGTDHPVYFNTVIVVRGGTDVELSPQEAAANLEDGQVPTVGWLSTNQKMLMSQIDYSLTVDKSDWDAALNPMFAPVLGSWPWWRQHVFKVHDVNGPTGVPVVFGLEVCLEHTNATNDDDLGVLRTLEPEWDKRYSVSPLPPIDVQLVTSCGMSLRPQEGLAGQLGGIAAICDGYQIDPADQWPNTTCVKVTGVQRNGTRDIVTVGGPAATRTVPDAQQIGATTGQLHNPRDKVTVWSTVLLP